MNKILLIILTLFLMIGNADAWPPVGGVGGDIKADSLTVDGDASVSGDTSLDGAVTINESGADKDFRIESDDVDSIFVIDGNDNTIGSGVINGDSDYSAANAFYIIADDTVRGITEYGLKLNTRMSLLPGLRLVGAGLFVLDSLPESQRLAYNLQTEALDSKMTFNGESTGTGSATLRTINAKNYISSGDSSTNLIVEMVKFDFQVTATSNGANHVITEFAGLKFTAGDGQSSGDTGITDAKIIDIQTLPDYGGTLTNQTAIHIDDMTNFTNNYGIVLDDGADCVWMDGVSGTAICSETVTLTATNINDLETTPITLASARTGVILQYVDAMLIWDYTADHTCTNADNKFRVRYNDGAGTIVSEAIDMNTFLEGSADAIRWMDIQATTDTDLLANVNQPLILDNEGTGDCTGGTGSTLDVKLTYRVQVTGL